MLIAKSQITRHKPSNVYEARRKRRPMKGCIAHYLAVERGGSTVYDVSGRHENLAFPGGGADPTRVGEKYGPSLSFDDASSNRAGRMSPIISGFPFSICVWAKLDDNSINHVLFSIGDSSAANGWFAINAAGGSNDEIIAFTNSPSSGSFGNSPQTSTAFVVGEWFCAVGVWAASNDVRVYLNGLGKDTSTYAHNVNMGNLDNVVMGRTADSTPSAPTSGIIDEVQVFSRVLDDGEVKFLSAPANRFHEFGRTSLLISPAAAGAVTSLLAARSDYRHQGVYRL